MDITSLKHYFHSILPKVAPETPHDVKNIFFSISHGIVAIILENNEEVSVESLNTAFAVFEKIVKDIVERVPPREYEIFFPNGKGGSDVKFLEEVLDIYFLQNPLLCCSILCFLSAFCNHLDGKKVHDSDLIQFSGIKDGIVPLLDIFGISPMSIQILLTKCTNISSLCSIIYNEKFYSEIRTRCFRSKTIKKHSFSGAKLILQRWKEQSKKSQDKYYFYDKKPMHSLHNSSDLSYCMALSTTLLTKNIIITHELDGKQKFTPMEFSKNLVESPKNIILSALIALELVKTRTSKEHNYNRTFMLGLSILKASNRLLDDPRSVNPGDIQRIMLFIITIGSIAAHFIPRSVLDDEYREITRIPPNFFKAVFPVFYEIGMYLSNAMTFNYVPKELFLALHDGIICCSRLVEIDGTLVDQILSIWSCCACGSEPFHTEVTEHWKDALTMNKNAISRSLDVFYSKTYQHDMEKEYSVSFFSRITSESFDSYRVDQEDISGEIRDPDAKPAQISTQAHDIIETNPRGKKRSYPRFSGSSSLPTNPSLDASSFSHKTEEESMSEENDQAHDTSFLRSSGQILVYPEPHSLDKTRHSRKEEEETSEPIPRSVWPPNPSWPSVPMKDISSAFPRPRSEEDSHISWTSSPGPGELGEVDVLKTVASDDDVKEVIADIWEDSDEIDLEVDFIEGKSGAQNETKDIDTDSKKPLFPTSIYSDDVEFLSTVSSPKASSVHPFSISDSSSAKFSTPNPHSTPNRSSSRSGQHSIHHSSSSSLPALPLPFYPSQQLHLEEDTFTEFKSFSSGVLSPKGGSMSDKDRFSYEMLRAVCGFMNGNGGRILFGITDAGYVNGIPGNPDDIRLLAEQILLSGLVPPPVGDAVPVVRLYPVGPHRRSGRHVLVVTVNPPSPTDRPADTGGLYFANTRESDSKKLNCYLRKNGMTRRLTVYDVALHVRNVTKKECSK
ncbi:hypothetical protein ADUPG1_010995 [Aduncisulcus paluster]|uniref:Schlafen AlbA-2 domain-containing protein n=1 Tax=Aduncisulcus paluster TaxID=2918883 RepID=A0ABQ5JU52_9EUKA|nr:hypothetical protein ADUPG1_010995 [Aduncisulcus paluster]